MLFLISQFLHRFNIFYFQLNYLHQCMLKYLNDLNINQFFTLINLVLLLPKHITFYSYRSTSAVVMMMIIGSC
jgi:hypothetical protein